MALPDSVSIKFNVFTLACRELLSRLSDLRRCTQDDRRYGCEKLLDIFDAAMKRFFLYSSPRDNQEAAELFGNSLSADLDQIRRTQEEAAVRMDDVVSDIRSKASAWQYQTDFEMLHSLGRDFARRFFADSPWMETRARLSRECGLMFEYRTTVPDEPFGHGPARMAYNSTYEDHCGCVVKDIILTRFDFSCNFTSYLAYLFMFFHEYTAHVYATDYENELFNDGWMLHAAAWFLKREWIKNSDQSGICLEQADIFFDHLLPYFSGITRRGINCARNLDSLLSLPNRFMEITYGLAAFMPTSDRKKSWPSFFINKLEQAFRENPARLRGLVLEINDNEELLNRIA
jgi:hypothetical protein